MSYDDSAAAYTPGTPYYDAATSAQPSAPSRAPRRGPLSTRLAARARITSAPAPISQPGDEAADATVRLSLPDGPGAKDAYSLSETPAAQSGPVWDVFTALLREHGDAAEALRDAPSFGSRWSSRADMLGACLDEYYQLTTKYNDARALLKEIGQELAPLRQQQMSAHLAVRALEERLELHSRVELRTAYLSLAEVEMRIFRIEQERDQLSNRVETLEGFMGFLSRIISTVRTIPAEALAQSAPLADAEPTSQPAANSAAETPGASKAIEAVEPVEAGQVDDGGENPDAFEELVIDADEAAELAARGDVEVIGAVEEGDETPEQMTETDSLPKTEILRHRPTR